MFAGSLALHPNASRRSSEVRKTVAEYKTQTSNWCDELSFILAQRSFIISFIYKTEANVDGLARSLRSLQGIWVSRLVETNELKQRGSGLHAVI